ncbi:MAG: DMP19 family protein [Coprobacillaceae bacterium]
MFFRKKIKNMKAMKTIHIGKEDIYTGDPQSIIEPLWYSVSIYEGEEKYNQDLQLFSLPQRYIFAIQWYVAEVNNGGHDQFYSNSTGIVWKDALAGFEQIKHVTAYNILKESANRLGGSPSMNRDERNNQLDKLNSNFTDLDNAFYKITDLDDLIMEYIKQNKKHFYFDSELKVNNF